MTWQLREHYARLRAGERPTPQREFGRAQTRVALVYPNSYYVGMSNLGFQTVYRMVNSLKGVLCDRFFPLDWAAGTSPLSIECERPLADFDILGFSVAFENDYVHMLKTLEMTGAPLRSVERDASHPLVVLGGAVTSINPEPVADFADIVVMGEGEETVPRLFDALARMKSSTRRAQLEEAARMEGTYVPALSASVPFGPRQSSSSGHGKRLIPEDYISYSCIISEDTEFTDTLLVEISRGCPYRCRFCAVGHTNQHFRSASAADVLSLVGRELESGAAGSAGGVERPFARVGLVSSAVGDHPELEEICSGLIGRGLGVSVSSLRVDRLSDFLLDCLAKSGTRTVTIAPEAGSERLRMVARKDISEEAVLDGAARAVAHGIPNVRLYFVVGLPTETEHDIGALMKLALKARKAMDDGARGGVPAGSLTVSLSPFVPKPQTPFQWSAMAQPAVMKRKISMIRRGLHGLRGIRVRSESLGDTYLQGILSRGDRRMSAFLEQTHRLGGDWRRAAAVVGLDLGSCLGARDLDDVVPWQAMYSEGQLEALAWEHKRAYSYVKE